MYLSFLQRSRPWKLPLNSTPWNVPSSLQQLCSYDIHDILYGIYYIRTTSLHHIYSMNTLAVYNNVHKPNYASKVPFLQHCKLQTKRRYKNSVLNQIPWMCIVTLSISHIVASELKDPIWHSSEWQIGSFSSEATIYSFMLALCHFCPHTGLKGPDKPPEEMRWIRFKDIRNSL